MIGDLFVYDKTMVYRRGILGERHKYTQSFSDHPSALDQIKGSGGSIHIGYRQKYEPKKKRKRLLEGEDEL